jgi:hypothetical protein
MRPGGLRQYREIAELLRKDYREASEPGSTANQKPRLAVMMIPRRIRPAI